MSVEVRGPSGVVVEVPDSVAPGLVASGHATYVGDPPLFDHVARQTPVPRNVAAQARPEGWPSAPAQGPAFDPGAVSVPEVRKYLEDADEAERARVLAAERAGKNRKRLVGDLIVDENAGRYGKFDPALHSVDEVHDYLDGLSGDKVDAEQARVLHAERHGQRRADVLDVYAVHSEADDADDSDDDDAGAGDGYDPSEHNAVDVVKYLSELPDSPENAAEYERVIGLERAGKNRTTIVGEAPFDPAEHNAKQVKEYLASIDDQTEIDRVLAAERADKNRATVVGS